MSSASAQWEHRRHFHWDPEELVGVAGSVRMWDRDPGSDKFSVVRVGVGKVKLAMTLEKPEIAPGRRPGAGHRARAAQVPQRAGIHRRHAESDLAATYPGHVHRRRHRGGPRLARAMMCQLAAFHSPADVQIIVVSAAPTRGSGRSGCHTFSISSHRDGCGERRLLFSSPAELEASSTRTPTANRQQWTQPSSGLSGGTPPRAAAAHRHRRRLRHPRGLGRSDRCRRLRRHLLYPAGHRRTARPAPRRPRRQELGRVAPGDDLPHRRAGRYANGRRRGP